MNNNTKGIIAVVGMAIVVFGVWRITRGKNVKIGDKCNNFGGGPDGIVIFDFERVGDKPKYYCKRCNESGCRKLPL
jgi:hypothetical protein